MGTESRDIVKGYRRRQTDLGYTNSASTYSLFHIDVQLFQHHPVKTLFFPQWTINSAFDCINGLFLGTLVGSIDLFCFPNSTLS